MPSIEVHIIAGTGAGRRLLLEQSPVSFGREPGNTLVLDLPEVSRRHGELRFEDDRWWLVNHSPNGTKLGRRQVTDKPREVKGSATVRIGKQAVMQLAPQAAAPAEAAPPGAAGGGDPAPGHTPRGMSRRAKLWGGIGLYLMLMLGLMVFGLTLKNNSSAEPSTETVPRLSPEQVAEEIRQPVPRQPPSERNAHASLTEANEQYELIDANRGALYKAYAAYRRALSHMPRDTFESGVDQRRYEDVQQRLVDRVLQEYERAVDLMRNQHYEQAIPAFETLINHTFRDPQSQLFKNAERHLAAARRALRER